MSENTERFIVRLSPWGNIREMCCDKIPEEVELGYGEWIEEFTSYEEVLEFVKMTNFERIARKAEECEC